MGSHRIGRSEEEVARAVKDINKAAVMLIEKDYVDDGFGGGPDKDVVRLMGEKIDPRGEITFEGTVPTIMARGGFYIKYMVRDGEDRPKVLEQFGGAILGIPWHTRTDTICMKLEVNLSMKVWKIRQGQAGTPVTMDLLEETTLTRRIMLLQVYAIYNPLGLLSPITIKYKLVLQRMVIKKLAWDEDLSPELERLSRAILREMILATEVVFP